MSNNTLLNAVRPKFYSAIQPNENINIENIPNQPSRCWKIISQNIIDFLQKAMKILADQCFYIGIVFLVLIGLFIGLLAIYFVYMILGLTYVVFAISFENTIVFIFGQGIYNKYFPVCTNTVYTGNNCYTTSSTYCS